MWSEPLAGVIFEGKGLRSLFKPLTVGLCLAVSACSGSLEAPTRSRGVILISIDTLRADHLGCYGYSRDTSPFIDSLAERGVLFENAFVQLPGTLPSHMSIFTGLHPAEHNVYPPNGVLSDRIPTLPEIFLANGFRTAGHTEGGYMSGGFGFARGFEDFNDHALEIETDLERTFARGLRFLEQQSEQDRFFLFLHTYSVHDPYADTRMELAHFPPAYSSLYWSGEPPKGVIEPTGPSLTELNQRDSHPTAEEKAYYRAAYDAQIRYLDDVLRDFVRALEAMGLMDEVTLVLTSDHGEELGDHGQFLHSQIYRETLHVPLIVLDPAISGGRRVQELVRSIDLAPTLYELAAIESVPPMSGTSLAPLLTAGEPVESRESLVESLDSDRRRSLVQQTRDGVFQLLWTRQESLEEGLWMSQEVIFDTFDETFVAGVESFHRPRLLEVLVDGKPYLDAGLELPKDRGGLWISHDVSFGRREDVVEIELQSFHRERRIEVFVGSNKLDTIIEQGPPSKAVTSNDERLWNAERLWQPASEVAGEASIDTHPVALRFDLTTMGDQRSVTLRSDSCDSPAELGLSEDRRCLSFQILKTRGIEGARETGREVWIPTEQHQLRLELPKGGDKKRVTLRVASCDSPAEVGLSEDDRCLSLLLSTPDLWQIELYDLEKDPAQLRDISSERSDLSRSLLRTLHGYRLEPVAPAVTRELDPEVESRLRALGYLP